MRILQLSDPHLLADPAGRCHGRPALALLRDGLHQALRQLEAAGASPDLLLISGDLCQDESWGGYAHLRGLLEGLPFPVALLPGNHDHPQRLRAALGRRAVIAPQRLELGPWTLLLLDSHRSGSTAGWLGLRQLAWVKGQLAAPDRQRRPVLVAVHHPPVPIGDAVMDPIRLLDGEALMAELERAAAVRGLVFGHVHQHWQGLLGGLAEGPLLGCPSTLRGFGPVQSCPLGRPDDPGGRLLELGDDGTVRHRLLRWPAVDGPNLP